MNLWLFRKNCKSNKKFASKGFAFIITMLITITAVMTDTQSLLTVKAEDAAWPAPPSIVSESAIVMDADTGAILYDKNSHAKVYPASVTKIMTGLLTIENSSLDEIVTYSATAANSVTWEDAKINTKTGEKLTVEQSLYALLLHSANEVAYGLAEHVAGSLSAFTTMMNNRAKELGALDTHFSNASGLSDPNHYTTAYDIAMISRACINNSTFVTIDSYTDYYKIPATNMTSQPRTIYGRHEMLKNRQFYNEYVKGGKTGFTDESGYTLVTFAEKDGMRLVCATFKSPDSSTRYADTKALLDYSFNNFKKVSISNNDVSSLFNSSSYYNSKVFNNSTIQFTMDASYVNLPSSANVSDIGISVDNSSNENPSDEYDYSASVKFTYAGNTVGSAKLIVKTESDILKSDNLPYRSDNNSTVPEMKKAFVVNIWYVLIAAAVILIAIYIYRDVKYKSRMRRRRTYKGSKNRKIKF